MKLTITGVELPDIVLTAVGEDDEEIFQVTSAAGLILGQFKKSTGRNPYGGFKLMPTWIWKQSNLALNSAAMLAIVKIQDELNKAES